MKRRFAALLFATSMAACAHAAPKTTYYPTGVVAPADWHSGVHDGVYASDTLEQCCFLAGHAKLTLDNPAGSKVAVFTFYVPDVKPLKDAPERVSVTFDGVSAGAPAELVPGMQDVTFKIPAKLRGETHITAELQMSVKWIPKDLGMNADERQLSVVLTRVGYV